MRYRDKAIVFLLVMTGSLLIIFRVHKFGPFLEAILPEQHYELLVDIQLHGHGEDVTVEMALPIVTARQSVRDEAVKSSGFYFHIANSPQLFLRTSQRYGVWEGAGVKGPKSLVYSCTVRTVRELYELADVLPLPKSYPAEVQPELPATDTVQSDSNEVHRLFEELVPVNERENLTAIVRLVYEYCHTAIKSATLTGTTDALTCLRLGEASCGGKSRLLAALLRHAGIPARLVNGLILKDGTWTSSHIWVEAWIDGAWVPFCPLNGYFAEKPLKYLVLYYGEMPLFKHTRDVNFQYVFHAKPTLAPPPRAATPPGMFNLWGIFEQVHIPIDLLKIVLLFPFGALVVVFSRNIVGIQTFGAFAPALLAVAFRDTGLFWGVSLFVLILILGTVARIPLERFQLLHIPRLGVLLTTTVIFMLAISVFGVARGYILPTRVSLLPIVIMTMTIERFSVITEEEGLVQALKTSLLTVIVACLAFWVMNWPVLERIVLAFPETLLHVVAMFFIIGRWPGLRLMEYLRFKELLFQ